MLNGGPGSDVINGGDGSDILVYGVGDTLDGGDDNGDDLVRIDAIGASITTPNVGGETYIHLSTALNAFNYASTKLDYSEGLLTTVHPNLHVDAVVATPTVLTSH